MIQETSLIITKKNKREFETYAILPRCRKLIIKEISISTLPYLPNCEYLHAPNNRIRILPPLSKCKYLNIINNSIEYLPELPECEILYASVNKLNVIPNTMKKVILLHISKNKIKEIPSLENCEIIYATGNTINKIYPLPKCRELYVWKNHITELNEIDFPKLRILNIAHNRLSKLYGFINLYKCIASHNILSYISLPYSEIIDVSYNFIETINDISKCRKLYISYNKSLSTFIVPMTLEFISCSSDLDIEFDKNIEIVHEDEDCITTEHTINIEFEENFPSQASKYFITDV